MSGVLEILTIFQPVSIFPASQPTSVSSRTRHLTQAQSAPSPELERAPVSVLDVRERELLVPVTP